MRIEFNRIPTVPEKGFEGGTYSVKPLDSEVSSFRLLTLPIQPVEAGITFRAGHEPDGIAKLSFQIEQTEQEVRLNSIFASIRVDGTPNEMTGSFSIDKQSGMVTGLVYVGTKTNDSVYNWVTYKLTKDGFTDESGSPIPENALINLQLTNYTQAALNLAYEMTAIYPTSLQSIF